MKDSYWIGFWTGMAVMFFLILSLEIADYRFGLF